MELWPFGNYQMRTIQGLNMENDFLALHGQLKSYLYRLSANREDAEDLLQDTYIRVKQKMDTFERKSSFKTWVFTIATNLAKDIAFREEELNTWIENWNNPKVIRLPEIGHFPQEEAPQIIIEELLVRFK